MIQAKQILDDRDKLRHVVTGAQHRVSKKLDDIWWWFMIRGVMALVLAIVALFWPEKTLGVLVNLLGAYLLCDGAIGAIGSVRTGGQRGFPTSGIVSIVVGSILIFWTGISVRLFLTLVGLWAVLQGGGLYLSNRSTDSDAETHQIFAIVGAVLAVMGLVLILWPSTGVVAISWLIAVAALLLGCIMLLLASRLRRLSDRIENRSKLPRA